MSNEFGYESIREAYERERGSNRLGELARGFYETAHDYLVRLQKEYEEAHAADPGTTEVRLLQDEYHGARESLVAMFDLRLRKILQMAHTASKGGAVGTEYVTAQEKDLYGQLRELLEEVRGAVLRGARRGERRTLVRVLEDLPPVTGTDLRVYLMRAEDVVALPDDTAQILVSGGKAVVLQLGTA